MPRLLDSIDGPSDLSGLDDAQLTQVAQEVREDIIDVIGEIGGHFGANLGTCELATVLHALCDSPRDKILWDVGHQAYPHKILTGRRDQLSTIRQYDGLAPFCSIEESEHDIMGAGHASTSIGYAVGLKEAMRKGIGEDGKVVAVIGDGALTGGVAFEALHNAGGLQTPIVIVLNDNGMSISPNVGALSRYFNSIRLNRRFYHARGDAESRLTRLPWGLGQRIERLGPEIKAALKAYWAPGLLFEELDLAYVGVVDGHDVPALRRALAEALEAERPVVVHIHTVKGKGFAPAEEGGLEGMEHGTPPSRVRSSTASRAPKKKTPLSRPAMEDGKEAPQETEDAPPAPVTPPQYTQVFADAMVAEAKLDPKVIGITAAMAGGTGLQKLADEIPDQYYDVGIAEQDAVLLAAGLALQGAKPVCAIYSTFLQRAYDQIVHDVCLQELDVTFAMDRAGLVGDDGPTHHGAFDISYLRCLPNIVIMAPRDEASSSTWFALPRSKGPRRPLPARRRDRRAASRPRRGDSDRHGGDPAPRRAGRAPRLRLRRQGRARRRERTGRARDLGHRRRRPLRKAARHRADRRACRRPRAARDCRGQRGPGRLRLSGPRASRGHHGRAPSAPA